MERLAISPVSSQYNGETMSDSQVRRQREADIEKSLAARPSIIASLRAGEELLSISSRVASEHAVDEKKAYKWVSIIQEEYSKRRKTVATVGLLVLWLGALTLISGLVMLVIGFGPPGLFGLSLPITLVIAGALVMVPGAIFSLLAGKLVFRVKS